MPVQHTSKFDKSGSGEGLTWAEGGDSGNTVTRHSMRQAPRTFSDRPALPDRLFNYPMQHCRSMSATLPLCARLLDEALTQNLFSEVSFVDCDAENRLMHALQIRQREYVENKSKCRGRIFEFLDQSCTCGAHDVRMIERQWW